MVEEFKEIMLTKEQISKRVKELGAEISKDYAGEKIIAICVLKGAFVFASDLIRNIDEDVAIDFMAVSSYGTSTKSSGIVRILKDLDTDIKGKHVIVVEDILDTGLTLHYLTDNLKSREPASLKICTLLDKPARRKIEITADYVGFSIENRFIIGYGLDYQEKYRNLPFIACLD